MSIHNNLNLHKTVLSQKNCINSLRSVMGCRGQGLPGEPVGKCPGCSSL